MNTSLVDWRVQPLFLLFFSSHLSHTITFKPFFTNALDVVSIVAMQLVRHQFFDRNRIEMNIKVFYPLR